MPLLVLMAALTPVLAPQAHAQSASASAGSAITQYDSDAANVEDIPPAFSDNVTNGTREVNEAMSGDDTPSGSAPAATSAATELTTLPETGGTPLLGLCVGVSLLGCGLLLARLSSG